MRETRQVLETASSGEKKLVSTPPDRKGMWWRVEAAFRKAESGDKLLTERELIIVQWISSSGGCHACYGRGRVGVVALSLA